MARWFGLASAVPGAVLLLAGCGGSAGSMGNPLGPTGFPGGSATYASNGQRIYMTATSASGSPITYQGGPMAGMAGLSCATCHGPDGHGASSTMMGRLVEAPDITWPVLTGPDPDMDHPPFTEDTVKVAITAGLDPAGQPLDDLMPRWSMSATDLDDLIAYLKTLR